MSNKKAEKLQTPEEILNEYGCPDTPYDENVTMFYPAIINAMKDYSNQQNTEKTSKIEELESILRDMINCMNSARIIAESELKKIDLRGAPLWKKAFNKIWKRAESAIEQ